MTLYFAMYAIAFTALFILVVQVHENARLSVNERWSFYVGFGAVCLAMLGEMGGIALNGTHICGDNLLRLAKFVDYTFTPAVAVAVAYPIIERGLARKMFFVCVANALFQLLSFPLGWTFYVDASGCYQHGYLYWVYLLFSVAALLFYLVSLARYGRRFSNRNIASLIGIGGVVIIGFTLSVVASLRVVNLAMAFAAAMMFIHYLEFAQQDMDEALDATSRESLQHRQVMEVLTQNYISAHRLNLRNHSIEALESTPKIEEILTQHGGGFDGATSTARALCTELHQLLLEEFVNPDTLATRLRENNSISLEFVGRLHGWCRASFYVMSRDVDGTPVEVLYAVAAIDEEKRYEQELLAQTTIDDLTGLLNQRAYRQRMDELREEEKPPEDLILASLDVNGLKQVNDNFGHAAGDDMLTSAGECVRQAFGHLGSCYRLGGDEFAVIAQAEEPVFEKACQTFDELAAKCTSPGVNGLSISKGYVCAAAHPEEELSRLARLADEAMYVDKRRYYQQGGGVDRRLR